MVDRVSETQAADVAEAVAGVTADEDRTEVVALLQELVRAASPNPPGDERAVQSVVRSYLADLPGVEVQDVGVDDERPMLIATLHGAAPGRTVVFGGHVDTVPAGDGWTVDPFGGELIDGRLYGRGASDMKGGVAGFLVALARLAEQRDTFAGTVVAHVVPDEEPGGQLGAALLCERGLLRGDAAIIAEPSELCVYRAQKGNVFARLRVAGRSAHGSMPHHGDNAISRAVRLALALEDEYAPRLGMRAHELLGSATLSIGTIAGGRRTNVVPDECTLTVDRRVVPSEDVDEAVAELVAFVGDRANVAFEHVGAAFDTPEQHPLVQAAVSAVCEVRGFAPPIGGLVGSSDARYYADGAGMPTVIVGPGAMDQAHVADEWVDVELLGKSVEVFRRLALTVLGDGYVAN